MDEDMPICSMKLGELRVDLMPDRDEVLGFSNHWYPQALKTADPVSLGGDLNIRDEIQAADSTLQAYIAVELSELLNDGDFAYAVQSQAGNADREALLLGTDGYWQEYLEAGTPRHCLRDDASLLTLAFGSGPLAQIDQASDADNLRYFSQA